MLGATSLYEYPSYDLNVYADEDMTMEVAEPATTAWTYVATPPCKTAGKDREARTEQVQAMDWTKRAFISDREQARGLVRRLRP